MLVQTVTSLGMSSMEQLLKPKPASGTIAVHCPSRPDTWQE